MSTIERSNRPASFSKIRSRLTFAASASASCMPSPDAMPSRISRPGAARADDDPVDRDLRPADPLDNCPHGEIVSLLLRCAERASTGRRPAAMRGQGERNHSSKGACLPIRMGMEAARNPWPALGTLLVRDGAVTPEQLELALAEKRLKPELRLGEILVENGFVTRVADLARPRRAARARVRRARLRVDRDRSGDAAAGEPRAPLPGSADSLPRGRLRARRGRRPDERDVLRRAPARPRDAGAGLRRLAGRDRAGDHQGPRQRVGLDRGSRHRRPGIGGRRDRPRPRAQHAGRRLHQPRRSRRRSTSAPPTSTSPRSSAGSSSGSASTASCAS